MLFANAHTLLFEEHRAGRVQLDGDGQNEKKPGQADHAAQRQHHRQQALDSIAIHGFPPFSAKFDARPMPDEALCALLWEYKDRGRKGYDLTDKFFDMMQLKFPDLCVWGPRGAGADVQASKIWKDYPNTSRPLDFVISSKDKKEIYAVGLARYDGDRGGAQEDDRTGGYKNCADEVLQYVHEHGLHTKVIFLNDGPGLLLGSMWEDYSKIEERHNGEVKVVTLRMIDERLTEE